MVKGWLRDRVADIACLSGRADFVEKVGLRTRFWLASVLGVAMWCGSRSRPSRRLEASIWPLSSYRSLRVGAVRPQLREFS